MRRLGTFRLFAMFVAMAAVGAGLKSDAAHAGSAVPTVALLDVKMINDNEGLDPTSEAEVARVAKLEQQFKTMLLESGRYTFIPLTPEIKAAVAKGQAIGDCGGCDVEFGKKLGADQVAWITVQKISNLILNMNVYMADVSTNKMTFLKSVDIRGNTDESWSRSMTYMLKNYMLNTEAPAKTH